MLDRRDFLKLSGTLGLTALFGGSLVGCSSDTKTDTNIAYSNETDYWTETGNEKIFEEESHVIYEIKIIDKNLIEYKNNATLNNEIQIPDGYALVSSEDFQDRKGLTLGYKYTYVNTVPIKALEYQSKDGETAYPFAGTPLDLEKAKKESKIYSKTMG